MKESATTALSYLRSNATDYDIDEKLFDTQNVHIHVPEGATPKDGPSAGVTMLTALASSFTQIPVIPKMAMTGEITLRGRVLPVGGIKEKLLAAKRAGVKTVIMPEANRKDVSEIPEQFLGNLQIIFVTHMREVLEQSLEW